MTLTAVGNASSHNLPAIVDVKSVSQVCPPTTAGQQVIEPNHPDGTIPIEGIILTVVRIRIVGRYSNHLASVVDGVGRIRA
jgi:hypothetical protein